MNKLNIIYKDIDSIKEYENNPRFNDNAVEVVTESIKQFGFKVPAVIDKNGIIVSGHTRKKAAKLLGLKEIPCIVADDLTEEQINAFRLADNKVSEFSEWDFNVLNAELEKFAEIDMSDFGFEINELDVDDFGTDFELADGDKSEICQMTFTLHENQKELIEYAIKLVKDEVSETFGNSNTNGNCLYEVVKQWAEQRT